MVMVEECMQFYSIAIQSVDDDSTDDDVECKIQNPKGGRWSSC